MGAATTLRLGTRASLLAMAQSRIVMRAIKAADPGLDIELVTVETRGDRDRDTPLSAVTDPGFFSDELDDALRDKRVDLCVHSMKDLPLAARAGIHTAAVPKREDPRDVVVFRPEVLDLLRNGEELRIGSSSERRATSTGRFLREALPRITDATPGLSFAPLRGPVEQRLARIRRPRSAEGSLDAVVLALAGLARLWGDRDGHTSIAPLLEGTRLMVLPLTECPTAPGQGALAVDCRSNDARVTRLVAPIHDAATARRVKRELAFLAARPEAERGGFGATTIRHDSCGTLVFLGGRPGAPESAQVIWNVPPPPRRAIAWDGADWVKASHYEPAHDVSIGMPPAVFLAHWRALGPAMRIPTGAHVWVSGAPSWRRLARRGVWVEGCADNLGFAAIRDTLRAPVLRLPPLADWTVLTRQDATATWNGSGVGHVLATYAIAAPDDAAALNAIRNHVEGATHFFWGSATQFRALRDWLPANSHHACGPGKTFQALRADGVTNLQAFPSRQEWQAWVA